jgi:hypothetical protein
MDALQPIREALAEWRAALSDTTGDRLVTSLGRLDELRRTHANVLDPQLAHFLERRSYEKAERWISTGGGCHSHPHTSDGDSKTIHP